MKSCIGKRSGTVIRWSDEGSDPGRDQLEYKIPTPECCFVREIQLQVDQQVLRRSSMCNLRGSLGLPKNPLESGHTYIEESHEVVAFQFLSKIRLTNSLLTNVVSAKARKVNREVVGPCWGEGTVPDSSLRTISSKRSNHGSRRWEHPSTLRRPWRCRQGTTSRGARRPSRQELVSHCLSEIKYEL